MSFWTKPDKIGIACAHGLAPYVLREVRDGGWSVCAHDDSSVTVNGTMHDAMRLNLWLRSAHRVIFPLFSCEAKTAEHLFRHALQFPWEDYLLPDGYFSVHGVVKNDTIRDTRIAALKIKDAIADRMREKFGRRPDSGKEHIGASIFYLWRERHLQVFLDTTGEPLSRRGYRLLPGEAPMQEALAASCVKATGWDAASPFVSPMCGSGTPAIEAALIAKRRAPGSFRKHFAFMSLSGYGEHGEKAWAAMKEEAAKGELPSSDMPKIVATDISREAVRIARANAKAAGVEQFIAFGVCDFADTAVPAGCGAIFMNPAYGERLEEREALVPLYKRIGAWLGDFRHCHAAILTPSPMLARATGLKPIELIPFFNGRIDCRLVKFS